MPNKIVDFVHLHCHSEFSILDGMPKVEDYIIKSAELGFPALALTEHGNMRSMVQLFIKCKSNFMYGGINHTFDPIKPIFGCEFYLTPNNYKMKGLPESFKNKLKRKSNSAKDYRELLKKYEDKYSVKKRWHLLTFAKNHTGLENILTLNYLSWKHGFYYRPLIDIELLKKYHEGLIITTACIGGVAPNLIIEKKIDDAYVWIKDMKKLFGDDMYIEIQPHKLDEQKLVNKNMVQLADELKLKIIATNDCHYLNKDDYKAHNMLLDINSRATRTTPAQDRWRFGDIGFYMRSKYEMLEAFKSNHGDFLSDITIKRALANTVEIAEKCNVQLAIDKKQNILPKIFVPEKYNNENDFIIDLCKKGWQWRDINDRAKEYAKHENISYDDALNEYKSRLKLELKRIFKMKFSKYFIIIHDLIYWARKQGIMVGAGRGSSAGSLVCYLTGITSVDPVRYDLLFDRFLHEKRVDYPDIDMDFEDDRRMEIFEYLFNKYGWQNTCMVGTIGRMKGRQALQDVARVLGIPYWETNQVTKHIIIRPEGDSRSTQTVEDSFKEFEISKNYNHKYPEVLPYVKKLESKAKMIGVHPAAIQIAPFKLYKYVPIEYREVKSIGKKMPVTGIDWRDCQDIGLIKIDLLGLGTLTCFKYILAAIEKRYGTKIDLEKISLEDKKTLNSFTERKFTGIFQFDSIGMEKTCEDMIFDEFEDIIAINSLYRPGSMRAGYARHYILRKAGKYKIKKIHPIYDDITKKTYGIVIYQEQLMQLFMRVAGYQPSKADIVRKKVAKSSGVESIWREKDDFMDGAAKNNVPKKVASWLFKNMSFFGSYAFNKSHSAAYSVISYWGMYLKTYYPTEFYYGLLKQEEMDNRILEFVKQAKKDGIKIIMPDINKSEKEFSIVDDKIISVGLVDVKGVGDKAAETISVNKPYRSMYEFLNKIDRHKAHKGVIKSLVTVGAFKSIYSNTGALLTVIDVKKKNDEKIKMSIWELMMTLNEKKGNELYAYYDTEENKLHEDDEQRLIASVSPLPTDKHKVEYYKFMDKYIKKYFIEAGKADECFSKERKIFILRGVIAEVKYNQVGDFHKEAPEDKIKKRLQWGARYSYLNIEDESGIKKVKVDIDTFSTFRHIIDKGRGTPVIVVCHPFNQLKMLTSYIIIDLDSVRNVLNDKKYLNIKDKYKALNKFERYIVKHPVSFVKDRKCNLKMVNKRVGAYEVVGLITKSKKAWTKKDDRMMMFLDFEDETGTINVVVWADIAAKYGKLMKLGNIIKMHIVNNGKGYAIDGDKKIILIKEHLKYLE